MHGSNSIYDLVREGVAFHTSPYFAVNDPITEANQNVNLDISCTSTLSVAIYIRVKTCIDNDARYSLAFLDCWSTYINGCLFDFGGR